MTTLAKFQKDYTQNIIGYSAIGMLASTCIGSLAVMASLLHGNGFLQMFLVFITVAICSTHNAAILTLQKPSIIYKLLIASVLINFAIIVYGFAS
ncbi:hypothetical protein [Rasiella sp. SM2506]|uniref:hypothetical protein n=1 Tax=Rasiella sp. SM2506 TaxID=3423914 RepID=UPI003D7BA939